MLVLCSLITVLYCSKCIFTTADLIGNLAPLTRDRNCIASIIPYKFAPMYSLHGEDFLNIVTVLNVTSSGTHCELNLDNYLKQDNVNNTKSFHIFIMICSKTLTLQLQPTTALEYRYIITQVELHGCTLSFTDLKILSEIFDLKVFNALNITIEASNNSASNQCWANNIVTSVLGNVHVVNDSITKLFGCEETQSDLAELTLEYMNMTEIPTNFKQKFINLQSLELRNNYISKLPEFTWTNNTLHLPGNISRTTSMQRQYADAYGIDVENNVFRNVLVLDNNRIKSLNSNLLLGHIQLISMKDNALERIDIQAFSKVRGLQRLHLQGNKLSRILDFTFDNLNELRGLNLGRNQLSAIGLNTFSGLIQLEILYIHFNNITSIHPRALTDLVFLKEIDLSNNRINHISENLFLKTKLVKVNLNNNPLTELSVEFFNTRSITFIDLSHTYITFNNLERLIDKLDISALAFSQSGDIGDIFAPKDKVTHLDLSYSQVTSFNISLNSKQKKVIFSLLLRNFKIVLNSNPIKCYCDIIHLREYLVTYKGPTNDNAISNPMLYYLNNWKCEIPIEQNGRPIGDLVVNELFSEHTSVKCISNCGCHRKCSLNITVIDCKNRSLTELPLNAPPGKLELWFQDNNITKLEYRDYLKRAIKINLQNNGLSSIDSSIYKLFLSENPELLLAGNHLQYIPETFKKVKFSRLLLSQNTFICDCHSLWLKRWISTHRHQIKDWSSVMCTTLGKQSGIIFEIPDKSFVCISPYSVYNTEVIVSSVVLSSMFIITVVSVFVFRREISFLIFVYFKIRIAKSKTTCGAEHGVFVVYPGILQEWVQLELLPFIKELLEDASILDIEANLIAGISYKDNIDKIVTESKNTIFVLSSNTEKDDLCNYALSAAREKCKNGRPDYFILLLHDIKTSAIKDKFLMSFIQVKRYIKFGEKRLKSRLDYFIHRDRREVQKRAVVTLQENHRFDIFLSTSYTDVRFCLDLIEKLQHKSYKLCVPERDFRAGVPKDINIIEAVNSSNFTIICLSNAHNEDEWTAFIFQLAHQKCLRNKNNKLIVILQSTLQFSELDENMRHYIETHACLKFEEEHLVEKLEKSFQLIEELSAEQKYNCEYDAISLTIDEEEI